MSKQSSLLRFFFATYNSAKIFLRKGEEKAESKSIIYYVFTSLFPRLIASPFPQKPPLFRVGGIGFLKK